MAKIWVKMMLRKTLGTLSADGGPVLSLCGVI